MPPTLSTRQGEVEPLAFTDTLLVCSVLVGGAGYMGTDSSCCGMSTVIRSTAATAEPIPQAALACRSISDITRMASCCALEDGERMLIGGDTPPGENLMM